MTQIAPTEPLFVRKLRHGALLSDHDAAVLAGLSHPVRTVGPRVDIWSEGSEPRSLPLLVEGWACRYRMLENGSRQILTILVPGDLCEPFGILPPFADYAIGTLTAASFAMVPVSAIRHAARESAAIEKSLWWDLLAAASIEREHLVSLGRRSASERLAHLFCELHLRLSLVGLSDDLQFDMPATQVELADLLGLSAVHLNRSLQELRALGLISLRGRRVRMQDLAGLRELSAFDPDYLHAHFFVSAEPRPDAVVELGK